VRIFLTPVNRPMTWLHSSTVIAAVVLPLGACVPPARLPALSLSPPGSLSAGDSASALATRLAPTLFVQRDGPFPLLRVAAVVHPTRPIIAYHLLWAHDVHLQWVPWAQPSDEEVVWVGYDSVTREPTDVWTYWHHTVLHADWRGHGDPAIDVQWGKHGALPHQVVQSDLPRLKTLNFFYAGEFVLLPDTWLGKIAHGGPWGFFHGYGRYRAFTDVRPLSGRLDAIVRAADPHDALTAVFGQKYSNKTPWPLPIQ